MSPHVRLADGIAGIVSDYDALIIDLWGVIHDGVSLYPGVSDCLRELSNRRIPYAMLTNAPRRFHAIAKSMVDMGLPENLYPHIMSSGEATWLGLKERRETWFSDVGTRCFHIGPARDENLFEEVDLERVASVEQADFIVNTGPWEDGELVSDYEDQLVAGAQRGLKMVCANPDLEVIRGGRKIICAGALAQRYEELDGDVLYYGKPYRPIYESCLHLIGNPAPSRVLAIGDSLRTDIAGAAAMGMDSVLVVGGIHGDELSGGGPGDSRAIEAKITQTCARDGNFPIAAIAQFSW